MKRTKKAQAVKSTVAATRKRRTKPVETKPVETDADDAADKVALLEAKLEALTAKLASKPTAKAKTAKREAIPWDAVVGAAIEALNGDDCYEPIDDCRLYVEDGWILSLTRDNPDAPISKSKRNRVYRTAYNETIAALIHDQYEEDDIDLCGWSGNLNYIKRIESDE